MSLNEWEARRMCLTSWLILIQLLCNQVTFSRLFDEIIALLRSKRTFVKWRTKDASRLSKKDIIWAFEAENSTLAEERMMSFKNLGHNFDSCNGSQRGHGIMDRALALSQIGPGSNPAIPNGLLSTLGYKEVGITEPTLQKFKWSSASKKMNQS